MVLLLKVDCLNINFGLGGITDILISSLGFSSQHCFRFPGPANLSLSLQNTQTPQSNCVHLTRSTSFPLHSWHNYVTILCDNFWCLHTQVLLGLALLEFEVDAVSICLFCNGTIFISLSGYALHQC